MTDAEWMSLALEVAEQGLSRGEPPFGVVVFDARGECLARAGDTVHAEKDWTFHAEVSAVRRACKVSGPSLAGATLVTTVEPCPMCFTAAWLAHMSRIVFGTTMREVARVTGGRQRELGVPASEMNRLSGAPLKLAGGVLESRCLALFTRDRPSDGRHQP